MNDMPLWLQIMAAAVAIAIAAERLWPTVFAALERRRVARNRSELAAHGLTPENYMASVSPTDYQGYAEAVRRFWPTRTRQERLEAALKRIGVRYSDLSGE